MQPSPVRDRAPENPGFRWRGSGRRRGRRSAEQALQSLRAAPRERSDFSPFPRGRGAQLGWPRPLAPAGWDRGSPPLSDTPTQCLGRAGRNRRRRASARTARSEGPRVRADSLAARAQPGGLSRAEPPLPPPRREPLGVASVYVSPAPPRPLARPWRNAEGRAVVPVAPGAAAASGALGSPSLPSSSHRSSSRCRNSQRPPSWPRPLRPLRPPLLRPPPLRPPPPPPPWPSRWPRALRLPAVQDQAAPPPRCR